MEKQVIVSMGDNKRVVSFSNTATSAVSSASDQSLVQRHPAAWPANPSCYKWGFAVIYFPLDGEFEFSLRLIPTSAPPTPGGGRWGITLIGALL